MTNLTGDDFLELPVFQSHRPFAQAGKFSYGKGLTDIDAKVGAYMEAIESYFTEPGNAVISQRWGTPGEVAGPGAGDLNLFQFCPRMGTTLDGEAPLLLAAAENIERPGQFWLPAELVWCPSPAVGQSLYGPSGNGLASGNTVLEATLHALLELIERDIWSFEFVRTSARRVAAATLPPKILGIVDRGGRNGLELVVQSVPNPYGLPLFAAFLFDLGNRRLQFFNGGWGCHLDRSVALTRAVTEAAQSRLVFLRGDHGRAAERLADSRLPPPESESELVRTQIERFTRPGAELAFGSVAHCRLPDTLEACLSLLLTRLRRVTREPIYRFVYTPPEAPLQVVRLVVPTLEHFREETLRVGPRLKAAIEASIAST